MFLNPTGADFGLPCAHQCKRGPPVDNHLSAGRGCRQRQPTSGPTFRVLYRAGNLADT